MLIFIVFSINYETEASIAKFFIFFSLQDILLIHFLA